MRTKLILVATALLTAVLAGCTDAPPSGSFTAADHPLMIEGTIDLEFQERVRNTDDTQLSGQGADDLLCPPAEQLEGNGFDCIDPSTNVSAHVMTIPEPSAGGYTLYWTNATSELMIGALEQDETGMYNLAATMFTEDHSGFDTVEIRMGEVVIATAANMEGSQSFAVNEMLTGASADIEWEGKSLTASVSGLADNVTYVGWLVLEDEEAGILVHDQSFGIAGDGSYEFEADMNIDDYVEFHIHITGSKVNVLSGTIPA